MGRLLAIDFMTVAGNDWFVAPLVMPVGTVCEVELVLVHDACPNMTHPRASVGDAAAYGHTQ